MKKNILHIIAVTALLFAFSGSLNAQNTIEGYVKDGLAGTPMVGVNIIAGGFGGSTNSSGHYFISGFTAGTTITVSVQVTGYSGSQRTIVVTSATNTVNFWFRAVSDNDGNSYSAVEIGSQVWMGENLKTTTYSDSTGIPNVTAKSAWVTLATPAYCWWDNNIANKDEHGAYYNFFAVSSGKLCPTGWHVPTEQEFTSLTDFLGGTSVAGDKLKEAGTKHWTHVPNNGTNETGFTFLPNGYRYGIPVDSDFYGHYRLGNLSTCASHSATETFGFSVDYSRPQATTFDSGDKKAGINVRCLKGDFQATLPVLSTNNITYIYQTTATGGGNVTSDRGSSVTARGVCWSTSSDPTISDDHTTNGSGAGSFTSSLSGLTPSTTYYVRAYATNSGGTGYGSTVSFTTRPTAPAVGTITQPTCALTTGSVVLSGLPPTGTWTLTRTPGNVTTTGTGTSTTITGLAAGSYTYTVTNSAGFTSTSSSAVVINTQPVTPTAPVVGTITEPTCSVATGSVVLNVLPSSGTWVLTRYPGGTTTSGTGTSTTISALPAGTTYNYTVTNAAGCISTVSANVVINVQPAIPTAPLVGTITQPTCALATGSVVLSGLPATGTWTLTRTPGGTTTTGTGTSTTISGLAAGTYNYTVTNEAGCTSPASANVVIDLQPATPTAPLVGTITQPTCAVATGSVILNGLPAGNWTINPGARAGTGASTTISGLASNTYNFTVTNEAGCTSSASANVIIDLQPAAPAAPVVGTITNPTCSVATGSVVLSGLPATGTWTLTRTPGGTTNMGTGTSFTITGLPAGTTYTFTVTNAEGCISPASTDVVITAQPATPTAPIVGTITQPTCALATGSVELSGLPAGNWTINPGAIAGSGASFTIVNLIPGTYNFTVTNAAGCTSAASANIIITAQPASPTATAINNGPICSGSPLSLTGGPNEMITYAWTGPNGFSSSLQSPTVSTSATAAMAGAYTLTVTSSNGCQNTATTTVTINPSPAAPTVGPITQPTCSNDFGTFVLSGLPEGNWTINPGGTSGSTTVTPTLYLHPGTYNFTVTDASGCISPAFNIVINAQPVTPTTPVTTVLQPTCAVATGTITVTAQNEGETYSFDNGSTFQASNIKSGLAAGSYNVIIKSTGGCNSTATPTTVNAQPSTPAAPTASVTVQPTCAIQTGTIVITAPTGEFEYSLDGGTFQVAPTFTLVAPGAHNVTARSTPDVTCVSPTTLLIVDAQPAPPTTTFSAATAVTPTTATLNGTVNANNTSTDVTFEYGTTPSYGSNITATPSPVTGTDITSVSANIAGLTPNTIYHYRVKAESSGCTTYGDDLTFTTYKSDAITDVDGNFYNIVAIGSQVWMAENLKVTQFTDLKPLNFAANGTQWNSWSSTTNVYCWYNDNVANKDTYGALYNWYAVANNNICPTGWHVPTAAEWTTLINYVGVEAGNKLKEAGTSHWQSPNFGATNESGFTALPGGVRGMDDLFYSIGSQGNWWSDSQRWTMSYEYNGVYSNPVLGAEKMGHSVRCVKDNIAQTIVTNVNDNGAGSLRNAIENANSTTGTKETITFNIPGTGPLTIQPSTQLPEITDPVVIDGYSQPGASATTSTLMIELDGTNAGTGSNGLNINASSCVVKGLIIKQFSGNGIQITGGTGNTISINSIYENGDLGINLVGGTEDAKGVTGNDKGDGDTGANYFQNYPVLESANIEVSKGKVTINGSLNSTLDTEYTIQFFDNNIADPSGYGEGQKYLGSLKVTTGDDGNASFSSTLEIKSSWGDVFTATATDPAGNTSEFSKALGGQQNQTIGNNWPLHFRINGDGVPNITDGSDITAVSSSFQTWAAVSTANISFTNDGNTTVRNANASDGINLVSFEDEQFPFSKGVLAVAAKTVKLDANGQEAQIIDADIIVNPEFVNDPVYNLGIGTSGTNAGYFDIQSVITHEIGHIIGLLHSGIVSTTMFYTIDKGITVRSLEQDDKSWASYRYPKLPDYNNAYGSISGTISYGYGLKPVAGALVVAINTTSLDTIHGYSDAAGYYLVPGLPPGIYKIYIEPLDGDVNGYDLKPGNISLYLYSNTVYTDYPGEYYNDNDPDNDSGSEDKESGSYSTINVTAGSNTGGKNIITNKDLTPPTVVSVSPVNGTTNFDILNDITVKFSEPVDETTLNAQTFYLESGGVRYDGSYTSIGNNTNIYLFVPNSALKYSTTYALHITTGVTDLKGLNLIAPYTGSFTTMEGDLINPSINEITPSNGSTGVFVTDKVRIFFSEPMDKASVENNFTLSWTSNSTVQNAEGSFEWDNLNTTATFTPWISLKEGTTYTIKLTTGATDLGGNPLDVARTFTFTTVLSAPPVITYIGPDNLATEVPVTTPVVVDFSEPVNTSSITNSSFSLTSAGVPVSGSSEFLNDNSRFVFRPTSNLNFSTVYTINLSTDIEDVSDPAQSMNAASNTTFTTSAKVTLPHIRYLVKSSGVDGAFVTITGSGFDPDPAKNTVTFNGTKAFIKSATLTSLVTRVPLGVLSGPVSVTVNGTASDNTMHFDVIPQSLSPCNDLVSNASSGSKKNGGSDVRPDGAFAYVTRPNDNLVSVVDLLSANPGVVHTIKVGTTPVKIDINPLGTTAYVTNFNSHDVSVIDLATNTETIRISVGLEPYGLVVTPDGKRVYVANSYSESLSVIDVDPNSGGFDHVVSNVSTGSKSKNTAVTSDGAMVLVTSDFGLLIIDSNPKDANYNSVVAHVSSGSKTNEVNVSADAGLAFVTTEDGHLLIINLHPENGDYSDAVISNVNTGSKGGKVAVSGDGLFVYVTDPDNDQILVYKIAYGGGGSASNSSSVTGITLTLHSTIKVGDAPDEIIISDDATKLYAVDGASNGDRELKTLKLCCGPVAPAKSIGELIITVQNMINNGNIPKLRGYALIVTLNSALRNANAGRSKLAIADLYVFNLLVKTYIKNKQIAASQGNALISSANAIINQLKGTKSDEEETYYTGVETQSDQNLITATKLGVIYPNPTSESITINYEIADDELNSGKVTIDIYDISGKLVGNLVDSTQEPGRYSATWSGKYDNGDHVPRGIYYIRFTAGNVKEVRQIMLVR